MQTPGTIPMRIALALIAAAFCLTTPRAEAQAVFGWQGTVGGASQWSSPTTWTNNAVPNAPGTIVNFIADFGATATTVNIGAGESFTVGVVNMTDSGGGNAGKFNIATNGAGASLVLDNGASKPVINYTTGGQFDNFMNVVVAGTNGFQKTGAGYVQMRYMDNTYTGTTVISAGAVRIERNLSLGNAANALELNGGALNLVAGTVNLTNRAVSVTAGTNQIQTEGTSTLNISGPLSSSAGTTLRKVDTGTLILSGTGNTLGSLELNGGSASVTGTHTNAGGIVIVKNNTAASSLTLNWSGTGTVATASGTTLLLNDGGTAVTNSTLNVTAGTLVVGDGVGGGRFIVGGKGVGAANVSGGTLTVSANKEVSIGSFAQYGGSSGNGVLTVSGTGIFQALGSGNFYVGYGQTDAGPGATNFGGTGVISLTGGTLETGRTIFTGPNATGAVTLNGGILKAAAANTNWIATTNNTIGSSGVTIDTAGYAMGISQPLQGSGALAKTGAGALALNAANTYAGGTTVSAGALAVNNTSGSATGSGSLSVASGAILTGNGIVGGSATINGTLSPGGR